MTKYKEEIVDIIKENTYNETDGRNLIRRGHDDLVEFYISEEKEMLNELDEAYRKAEAFDEIKRYFQENVTEDGLQYRSDRDIVIALQHKFITFDLESEDE